MQKARVVGRGLFELLGERLPVGTAAALEAVAAIDRLVAAGNEGHFGRLSALAASRLMHFARGATAAARTFATVAAVGTAAAAARSTLRFTRRAAIRTTVGLVLEAFAREELLFAGSENELAVAINAVQGLVCVHV
jgi:hypothetical protein